MWKIEIIWTICVFRLSIMNNNNEKQQNYQLYTETHDTLPPIEEEETDRQQRVYRGQPSTVGQVQRDRDGLITQHVNALPSHGKVGSFSFGSQVNHPHRYVDAHFITMVRRKS